MGCEFICDGCGKRQSGSSNGHNWFKPHDWFERSDKDGIQTACSRECIDKISKKTGKTKVIIPGG